MSSGAKPPKKPRKAVDHFVLEAFKAVDKEDVVDLGEVRLPEHKQHLWHRSHHILFLPPLHYFTLGGLICRRGDRNRIPRTLLCLLHAAFCVTIAPASSSHSLLTSKHACCLRIPSSFAAVRIHAAQGLSAGVGRDRL